MRFIATCKMGLESTVAFQLRQMDMQNVVASDAKVTFDGTYFDMARALLWLRTAERLLLEVASFPATTFDMLFEGVRAIPWHQYLRQDSNIHVTGKSAKSTLFSVSDCQSIVKKAVIERLKDSYHCTSFPETGNEVILEIGLLRDTATITLDCCGAGLSRRGYRTYNVPAPISETLGAAIIQLSRYYPDIPLIDPMCGSGTMPIEAAMIAENRAPGLLRDFSSENWFFADHKVFDVARSEARDAIRPTKLCILGSDIDAHCIDLSKKHAKKAGVMVDWAVKPVAEIASSEKNGIIVCNPPYGERLMQPREIERLYRQMRGVFDSMPDWSKNIISGYREFEKTYGKRADKRRKLSNGGMTCTLYQYFREKKQ